MRVLRSWLFVALAVGAALGAIVLFARRADPLEVRAVAVARGKVERTVAGTKAGALRSRRASDLSFEASGTITAVHVREGRTVAPGELLLTLDTREAEAASSSARAELGFLEALAEEAGVRQRDAARTLRRIEVLHAEGVASDADLDEARLRSESLSVATAAARSRVEVQKGVVARALIGLAKCEVRAPFGGVVAELSVELGEWAVPGKRSLRLIDLGRLYVTAELDEVDIGPVREGLPARVVLDPYRDRRLAGRVCRVAPYVSEVQEQNRTLEVEVEIVGGADGLELKPGTSADVEVILEERAGALRVPASALMEGDRILVVGPDLKARSVPLRIGLRNWEFAEVLDGAVEGDRVIVSLESERLQEGTPVRVVSGAGP
jgi:HlyD family secretion protein